MFSENKTRFEKCGLLKWHEAGYKGAGLRIAVWDERPFITPDMTSYASIPQGSTADSPTHATKVAKCLHEAAPEAQIFMLSASTSDRADNVNWIITHHIDLISCSYIPPFATDVTSPFKELKASGIPILVASGNEGQEGFDSLPSFSWTIAVGAAAFNDTKTDYTNYGPALDCLSYIPYIEYNGNIVNPNGTSFAQPFAAGMVACWMAATGIRGRAGVADFVKQYSRDVYDPGKDKYSGYGVLTMPLDLPKQGGDNSMAIQQYQYPFKSKFVFGTAYGTKGSMWKCGWHSGLDLKSTNYGGDGRVYPISTGVVQTVAYSSSYGNYVIVEHEDGYLSLYAHLRKVSVSSGQRLDLNTVIGQEGSTGNSTGLHLHIEVHKGSYKYPASIDPKEFIENKILEAEIAMEKAQFEQYMAEYEAAKRAKTVSSWAQAAWDLAVKKGIVDGTMPQSDITREQVMVILNRMGVLK